MRLIVQFELVALDGGAKVLLQRAAFAQPHVHVGLEEADRSARFALGAIERRIGIREQRGLVVPVRRIDRDADREGGAQLMAVHLDRIGEHGLQPLGQRRGSGRLLRIAADQGELVAAEARHECAFRRSRETRGDHAQQFVARRMSEDVIDLLEAVAVEREQRKAFMRGGGALQRRCEAFVERRAVRQVGQRVMVRKMRDLHLGAPALGDVLVGRNPSAADLRLVGDRDDAPVGDIP